MSSVTTQRNQDATLAADVRYFLSQTPRQLPSRALYDTLGSALFDAICELPWYPLARAERRLIRTQRDSVLRQASLPTRIVELGPGNGSKLDLLLGEGTMHVRRIDLVDVSAAALREAARRLRENRTAQIVTHEMRYEDGLRSTARSARDDARAMVVFLGSNIGNFDPVGSTTFLKRIRESLGPGDSLLISADLVKPERQLLLAYDDPLGVTAAFNRNLLLHLNRVLGATFDVAAFAHRAVWNSAEGRVEMHLVSLKDQSVDVPEAGVSVSLLRDDVIWTESSYKYSREGFNAMLQSANLFPQAHWLDEEGQFLLVLAAAR